LGIGAQRRRLPPRLVADGQRDGVPEADRAVAGAPSEPSGASERASSPRPRSRQNESGSGLSGRALDQRGGLTQKSCGLCVGGPPGLTGELAQSGQGAAGLLLLAALVLGHGQKGQRCGMVLIVLEQRRQGVSILLAVELAEAVLGHAEGAPISRLVGSKPAG